MHTTVEGLAQSRFRATVIRFRALLYFGLLLLAAAIALTGRNAITRVDATPAAAQATTAPPEPAAQAEPPDDRPLVLPDR
jgi:hypothetical protein